MKGGDTMRMDQIKAWCEAHGYCFTRAAERAFARRIVDGKVITIAWLNLRHQIAAQKKVGGDRSALELFAQAQRPRAQMLDLHDTTGFKVAQEQFKQLAIAQIGEAEFNRQLEHAALLTVEGPEGDAARAQHEIDIRENNAVALSDEDLHAICIDVMGAPAQQMKKLIRHKGKVRKQSGDSDRDLVMTSPLKSVVGWLSAGHRQNTVMLSGPAMTGKTTAALYALYYNARNVNSRMRTTSFYSAYQMARIIASNYQDSIEAQERMYHAPFLVIDNLMPVDMMTTRNPKQFVGFIMDLFDQRQSSGFVTIVTSTLSFNECVSNYGSSMSTHFQPPRGVWHEHRNAEHRALTQSISVGSRPSMKRIKERHDDK